MSSSLITQVRPVSELLQTHSPKTETRDLLSDWIVTAIQSDQCISYMAIHQFHREGIIVDAKLEDVEAYRSEIRKHPGIRWLFVIDTHTHADHISFSEELAKEINTPYLMAETAPSRRVHCRISKDTSFQTQSGALQILLTPGHTPDSLTIFWGPLIFGGDTVLVGDVGRDDLPGGNAEAHFESLQKIKKAARKEMILLPGHDHLGGRVATWGEQLLENSSLQQNRADFVSEAEAFDGKAPDLLKKSLKENMK